MIDDFQHSNSEIFNSIIRKMETFREMSDTIQAENAEQTKNDMSYVRPGENHAGVSLPSTIADEALRALKSEQASDAPVFITTQTDLNGVGAFFNEGTYEGDTAGAIRLIVSEDGQYPEDVWLFQETPSINTDRTRKTVAANENWSGVQTAQEKAQTAQTERLQPFAVYAPSIASTMKTHPDSVIVKASRPRQRPAIVVSAEISDAEDEKPDPEESKKPDSESTEKIEPKSGERSESRRPETSDPTIQKQPKKIKWKADRTNCDECDGQNGPTRAHIFDVPQSQRNREARRNQAVPPSLCSSDYPDLTEDACTECTTPLSGPLIAPASRQDQKPSDWLCENTDDSCGEDLSQNPHPACRKCDLQFQKEGSLPWTALKAREAKQKEREESPATWWATIRDESRQALVHSSEWPNRVRSHALWEKFSERKCLGPSDYDNFCWEDKNPSSLTCGRCQTHQSVDVPCGNENCGDSAQTWWVAISNSRRKAKYPPLESPLCDGCEGVRGGKWCFTCDKRLKLSDLAGRCDVCYTGTSLHRDWNKQTASWTAQGKIEYLKPPWKLIQEDRDRTAKGIAKNGLLRNVTEK